MYGETKRSVFLVSGPYGVGKDTLLGELLDRYGEQIHRVRTLTTRPTSTGTDPSYRTVSLDKLRQLTSTGRWLVNQQFSGAVHYATSLTEIEDAVAQGKLCIHSIFAGEQGAGKMREVFGRRLFAIGVLATTGGVSDQLEVLKRRLKARTRDDDAALDARLTHQADPISYVLENPSVHTPDGPMEVFDTILVNDDLPRITAQLSAMFAKIFDLEGL